MQSLRQASIKGVGFGQALADLRRARARLCSGGGPTTGKYQIAGYHQNPGESDRKQANQQLGHDRHR